jgi:cytochrome c-type biogenesis protein CcmH/NrfG
MRAKSEACVMSLCVTTLLLLAHVGPAPAQGAPRVSCQGTAAPPAVASAKATLQQNPDELGAWLKLADAMVDQGCYADAVTVLEAGQAQYPRSSELSAKLRDVRSMLTEETYIQGMTQAEDAAKQQHNQLRCTKLADVEACNAALQSAPNDLSLLVAKADAQAQNGHTADAVTGYRRALQLSPANEAVKEKLATALAHEDTTPQDDGASLAALAAAAPARTRHSAASTAMAAAAPRHAAATAASTPAVALNGAQPAASVAPATYSNEAPAGRSN